MFTVTFPAASSGTAILITASSPTLISLTATFTKEPTLETVNLVVFSLDKYLLSPK